MTRSRKVFAVAVVLLAIVAVAWLLLRTDDPTAFASGTRVGLAEYKGPNPTGVAASLAGADLIARGEYLTRAADCAACHNAPGGKPFAGGLAFKLPMIGTLYSTNITPDAETGIGGWSDDEFVRTLHEGIGKDGEHLYPAYPYASYTLMTRDDALAIKAYLFSLKPVKYTPPANDISFPFNQRYLMTFWNLLFNPNHRFRPNTDQSPDWNRGAYLVEALGHCGDCHTPRNLLFGLKAREKFAGAIVQGWKAYNITPDQDWGIGGWSEAQLQDYLSHGHAEGRGSASGPMAEVVDNSLRFLSDDDIKAMGIYVTSVPAVSAARSAAAVRAPAVKDQVANTTPAGTAGDYSGLHMVEGACTGCHSFEGSGTVSNYATLLGSRSVNDPEGLNATQAMLEGTHLHTKLGKMFMPDFGKGYSDAEIAALVNYVTGQFGASASSVTPGDVAKRRQAN
jgi:mono/diheme cytochrome c family protein